MTTIHRISNDKVSLALDEGANLTELKCLATGRDYAGGQGLWRVIYSYGLVVEDEILAEDCACEITSPSSDSLHVSYEAMQAPSGREAFALEIGIRLDGEDVLFSASLANNSAEDRVIREFNFPTIKDLAIGSEQCLYGFEKEGKTPVRIENVAGAIQRHYSAYVAEDNRGINMPWTANGFAMFSDETDSLYLGDHDPDFELTTHLFRKRENQIDAGFHRSPYLSPGESASMSGFVVSPMAGDWHVCAKKFRSWFDQWYKPAPKPESLTDGFKGWYRLIMRHQYGKILFRHDEMPRILQSMKETGIDTLLIFGWWREGMDAGYPGYEFDETQGGHDALKEHFRAFREAGGKVLLYFNGRLIDTATEYYHTRGKDIAIRGCDGCNIVESYPFAGPGINLRHQFGFKSFALACPHSREWMDILKGHIDKAIELEADGVFFDQVGMVERPCFNPDHGHPVPVTDGRAHRMAQLEELRAYLKDQRPDMSFGIECVSHFSAPYTDYCHSFPGWNVAVNPWQRTGEKPKLNTFVELFRYTFPEVIVSDREIRDDTDIERRVNLALLRGLVSDVEVHRCRSLIDETPHYKAYLTEANQLRDRFRRLIVNGIFRDTDGASCNNPELSYAVFTAGDELAVITTQSHLEAATADFGVPGYVLQAWGALGEAEVTGQGNGCFSTRLGRHGLLVAVFRSV
jgi:hypothetical protein